MGSPLEISNTGWERCCRKDFQQYSRFGLEQVVCCFWFFTGNSWLMKYGNIVLKNRAGLLLVACYGLTPLPVQFAAPVLNEQNERLPSAARLSVMWSEVGFSEVQAVVRFFNVFIRLIFRNYVTANGCVPGVLQVDRQLNGKAVMGSFSSYWIKSVSFLLLWLYLHTNKAYLKHLGALYHLSRNVFSLSRKEQNLEYLWAPAALLLPLFLCGSSEVPQKGTKM